MCGITGYIGGQQATEILMDGLRRLEYRGYDSCGVANIDGGKLYLKRVSGRVEALEALTSKEPMGSCTVGIGHTRWATHGAPTENNAHPHIDCGGQIVVVHNGIIENYQELKDRLKKAGHKFRSETDTEVVAHLVEEKIKSLCSGPGCESESGLELMFIEAVRLAIAELSGSFALAALWAKCPDIVVAAREHSPMAIGLGSGENFLASDASAFLKHTNKAVFLNDGEMAAVKRDSVSFFSFQGERLEHSHVVIPWDPALAEKGEYRHFMLKEIHEQSYAVKNTLRERLLPADGVSLLNEMNLSPSLVKDIKGVQLLACGTAYHAGLIGRYLLESFGIPAAVDFASEFSDKAAMVDKRTLVVAVSQSGETADTLHAVREARTSGASVLAITNTRGSTLARESDYVLHTRCGPEIGVASTKAFMGQLAGMYMLAVHFAVLRGRLSLSEAAEYTRKLLEIPGLIAATLDRENDIEKIAAQFAESGHYLFLARHINYPTALEGALKIKEISYVHAEGYAAGEMKHGPIAIIYKGMPVIAIATSSKRLPLICGNMEEARARGAEIIAIVDEDSRKIVKASRYIQVPRTLELLSPMINIIPLQLFAYFVALARDCDIDKPRNLAKSVTVR